MGGISYQPGETFPSDLSQDCQPEVTTAALTKRNGLADDTHPGNIYVGGLSRCGVPVIDSATLGCTTRTSYSPGCGNVGTGSDEYLQDGTVHLNLPHFSSSGSVIDDLLTGANWDDSASGTDTWVNASGACAGVGRSLPSVQELSALVDYGGSSTDPLDGQFVYSSQLAGLWTRDCTSSACWVLSADKSWILAPQADGYGWICTSQPAPCTGLSGGPDGPESATDPVSGLRWTRASVGCGTFEGAVRTCRDLVADGLIGWRLPTVKEYQSHLDYPQLSRLPTSTCAGAALWTSTAYDVGAGAAYAIETPGSSLPPGTVDAHTLADDLAAYCVR